MPKKNKHCNQQPVKNQHRSGGQFHHQSQTQSNQNVATCNNMFACSLAIAVPVTSRSIGFCTTEVYKEIYNFENRHRKRSSIYRSYRAFLAFFQYKVVASSQDSWLQGIVCDEKLLHQQKPIRRAFCMSVSVPAAIAELINAVGTIEVNDKFFVPFVAPNNYTAEGAFIPQPEHVYLYNLRETVVALADENTAVEYRCEFYKNNSIPGTIWQNAPENPVLMNPDEIIPSNYHIPGDLDNDFWQVVHEMYQDTAMYDDSDDSESDYSHVRLKLIDLSTMTYSTLDKSILMCQNDNIYFQIRVSDRRENEKLMDYCSRGYIWKDGGHEAQHLVNLTKDEFSNMLDEDRRFHTFKFLLGECPSLKSLRYPHYSMRESSVCCQRSSSNDFLAPQDICMCITTRSIGFGLVRIFKDLSENNGLPPKGNIYQVYRVFLWLIQLKVVKTQKAFGNLHLWRNDECTIHTFKFEHINIPLEIPDPIARSINAVGCFEIKGIQFAPTIAKNQHTDTCSFIPQSELVYLYNLRKTVVALADENTPTEYRLGFYQNNPIPGTVWRNAPENPVLTNPDDVMPADYGDNDLRKDFVDAVDTMSFMKCKDPTLFEDAQNFIDVNGFGKKEMLTCNDQSNMRVVDRGENESLKEYYKKIKLAGNIMEFYNYEALSDDEQLNGIRCLLGERPVLKSFCYPDYVTRDKRVCVQRCNVPYVQCCNFFDFYSP